MLGSNSGWVPNPMEILAPYLEQRGYECMFSSRIVNRYARFADILRTLYAQRNRYDIVCLQVYSGPSLVVEDAASVVARSLGKPLIMVLHGGAMPEYMKKVPRWTKHILSRADAIITPSQYLTDAVGSLGFRTRIIPNIIPLAQYPYKRRCRVRPKLLWMRTFYAYYNPSMAVHVLRELLNDFPDATLTLSGQEKGIGQDVRNLVDRLGLAGRVRFPGFLDMAMKREEFARHDVFLNTTFIDNMPVCLVEAGAFGLPIVSTNVGGVPYLVKHEESALLVNPDDATGMADAVRRLISEPQLASRLSTNGRAMAEQSSPDRVVPMWEEVFNSMTNTKRSCAASAA